MAKRYTFEQLSKEAKETAREWWRTGEIADFGSDDMIYEPAQTAADILGIEFNITREGGPDIRWSGFSSQGDGASFVGEYSPSYTGNTLRDAMSAARITKRIREEFGNDKRLWSIADRLYELQSKNKFELRATIGQSGNYYHEMSMNAEVTRHRDDEDDEEVFDKTADDIMDLMRDFAKWIYRNLEDEYESRLTDEYVDDTIMENEYKFTKDGKRAD